MGWGLNAQNNEEITNLTIGDKVPNIKIEHILNWKDKSAVISDFKDQLLILDFMHTSCGSCLEAQPHNDSMQSKFGDKIQIMVVTPQKKDFVQDFLDEYDSGKYGDFKIPWVVEDDMLKEYFKYRIISHLVWVYKGEVVAITSLDHVTEQNIQRILNGEKVDLPVKNDLIEFDFDKDFFKVESNQGIDEMEVIKYSAIRGHIKGIDPNGKRFTVDSITQTIRLHIANRSIINMYNSGWSSINRNFPIIPESRIIMEVKNPIKYNYISDYGDRKLWNEKYEITYESVLPMVAGKVGAYTKLVSDLDQFLGLHGRWEKRTVPCLVIEKTATDQQIEEKKEQAQKLPYTDFNGMFHHGAGTAGIKDDAISRRETNLFYLIGGNDRFNKPLVDESGYEGTFIFPTYLYKKGEIMEVKDDIGSFKKGLNACGFDLVEKECETDVFVLTELGNN